MSVNHNHNIVPEFVVEFLKNPDDAKLRESICNWLKDENNQKLFNELCDIWQASIIVRHPDIYNVNEAWHKTKNSIPLSERGEEYTFSIPYKKYVKRWIGAAILVLCTSIISVWGYSLFIKNKQPLQYTEFTVPYGSKSRIVLPDSTEVWINAGSVLRYNSDYNRKNRDLFLDGEAFFSVNPNTKLPFEVKLKSVSFVAVGTSFNIKAYSDEKTIEATVLDGIIQIIGTKDSRFNKKKKVYLATNQKLILSATGPELPDAEKQMTQNSTGPQQIESKQLKKDSCFKIVSDIDPLISSSWKDEKWILEQERLDNFAVMLQRRYNVKIIFTDESLKNYTFSGVIKNETIEQMLRAIYLTAPVEYKIENNVITFSASKRLRKEYVK